MQWIVSFTVILLIIGAIFGLTAVNFNPEKGVAEARQIDAATEYQRGTNEQDLRLKTAQTDAEIHGLEREQVAADRRAAAELIYIQELNQEKVTAYENFMEALSMLLKIIGVTLTAAGGVRMLWKPITNLISTQPRQHSPRPSSVQPSVVIRHVPVEQRSIQDYAQMHINARQNELLNRAIALRRMQVIHDPASISKGQRDKLPLAI